MTEREQLVQGLRALADYLERRPDIEVPYDRDLRAFLIPASLLARLSA